MENLVAAVAEIQLPHVVTSVIGHHVEQLVALLVHGETAQRTGTGGKAHDAFLNVVQFHHDGFGLFLFWLLLFGFLLVFVLVFPLFLFSLFLLGFLLLLLSLLFGFLVDSGSGKERV